MRWASREGSDERHGKRTYVSEFGISERESWQPIARDSARGAR